MSNDELIKVEQPAIDQLIKLGWSYVAGDSLAPALASAGGKTERDFYRDVVLVNRLEAALRKLNPWLSDEHLGKMFVTHHKLAAL